MSLIGGYFSGSEFDTEACLRKLEAFAILPGESGRGYHYQQYQCPGAVIYAKYKQTQPQQLYSYSNDKVSLLTLGFNDLPYPPDCAAGLDTKGFVGKIQQSEGEFVCILLDRPAGTVYIINDRFGVRPMYIMRTPGGTWFSSNFAFLLDSAGQKARPDPMGVLQIISYGHTLTPQTHTQGVQRLFPGSCVRIDKTGFKQEQYWQLKYQVDTLPEPLLYSRQVFEAFRQGLAKKISRSSAGFISLSGGLDSRLVVGAAHKLCNYFVFTFSNDTRQLETADVKVARQICRRLGLEHRVVQMTSNEASSVADTIVRLTGGQTPLHHPLKNWQAVKMMQQTTGFKIGGGCGDPIAGDYVNSIYQIEPKWTDTLLMLYAVNRKLFGKTVLASLLRRELIEGYLEKTEETMFACLADLCGPTAAHKIAAWSEIYFNSGFTFCGATHSHPDISEASPHLGYSYVNSMLRLPADWLYNKNFYMYMIYHCLPEIQDIVYANTGQKLPSQMKAYKIPARKRLCRAVAGHLPFAVVSKIWGRPAPPRASAIGVFSHDSQLFGQLNDIIHNVPVLRDVFEPSACRRFFCNYAQGKPTIGTTAQEDEMLGSIVSLCYWFKNTSI